MAAAMRQPAMLAALAALLAAIVAGLIFWRRKAKQDRTIPQIELPLVSSLEEEENREAEPETENEAENAASQPQPHQAPIAATPPPTAPAENIPQKTKFQVKVAATSLSRSMMNATFAYHLELQNLGITPVRDIRVFADLVTAHGRAPVDEQLADSSSNLPIAAEIASLAGRGNHSIRGEFRLPLRDIKPITQGKTTLYIPLFRLKILSDDIDPVIHTFVVGVRPPDGKGKLLPFRLDEMPQTYRNIGLRQVG